MAKGAGSIVLKCGYLAHPGNLGESRVKRQGRRMSSTLRWASQSALNQTGSNHAQV